MNSAFTFIFLEIWKTELVDVGPEGQVARVKWHFFMMYVGSVIRCGEPSGRRAKSGKRITTQREMRYGVFVSFVLL